MHVCRARLQRTSFKLALTLSGLTHARGFPGSNGLAVWRRGIRGPSCPRVGRVQDLGLRDLPRCRTFKAKT